MSWEGLAAVIDASGTWPELASVLRELHAAGQTRWAELPALPPEDFVAHVARQVPEDGDPVAYVRRLVAPDLYLACACTYGLPGAVEAFDAQFLSRVPDYVRHVDRDPGFGEEIQQQLRERLLVRRGAEPARIADYSGRGALASWLRVTAVRVALNRRTSPDEAGRAGEDATLHQLATDAGPDLWVLRARYTAAMSDALACAVAALTAEQRVILRMYFGMGKTTQQIAAILRVDRSTAARRLVAARRAVFDETRRLVCTRVPIAAGEFASVARAIHDQLDVSLGGLLADPVAS
ncbi:MAG TPA: sigma factor-like helix-turn-helix DNA-binding protein [Kofleriaceae bacterium]